MSRPGKLVLEVCLVVIALAAALSFGAFTSPREAISTLEAQGYSDIQITDKAWFMVLFRGCDKGDVARFTAKVTNPAGKPAEVTVCTGLFKGSTIRGL